MIYSNGPRLLSSAVLEETGVKSGRVDDTFNVLFEIQKLTENKSKTQEEFGNINNILNEISEENGCELYGTVLRKWYIERLTKEEIAEDLGYSSKQTVYDIRNKAIRKFAVRLFGIEALRAV